MDSLDSPVGKKARAIEASIVKQFSKIFRQDIEPLFGKLAVTEIRKEIGQKIHDLIRSKVEQAYRLGSEGVASLLKEPNPKTSREDFANIEIYTEELENQFWTTIEQLNKNQTSFEVEDNRLHEAEPYNTAAALLSIGSYIAFFSVNNAVASKTTQLNDSIKNMSEVEILQRFGRNALIKMADRKLSDPDKGPIIFVFLTASDAKVDLKFCTPLHRTEYAVDDAAIPRPPLHRHCRCVLVPKNTLTNEFLI